MARSLGSDTNRSSQGASTSRRPTGASGSPPKRPRIDTSGTTRVTRASSAAAARAADTAGATLAAAVGSTSAPATTAPLPPVIPPVHTTTPFLPPQGPSIPAAQPPPLPVTQATGAAAAGHPTNATAGAAPQVAAAAVVAAAAALQAPPPGAVAPNWVTYDGNPPRAFLTATDNAPQTVGVDRTVLTANADPNQMQIWDQTPDALLVYVGGGSSDSVADAHAAAALIADVVNLPPNVVQVGAATRVDPRQPAPPAYAVAGVPPLLGQELGRLRILCSTTITLFVTALYPALSGFLGIHLETNRGL
ncbi:hypothetical protein C8J57DRAFT_1658419 [Mycena rebaudengoi]|nr:hypothetical protein C8J57DRAFT_1658419 [Mycena rebaudengoi]